MEYEAIITMQNGDIVHYGVLGMKWGQHQYAKNHNGSTTGYVYKSLGQKHAQKVYNKSVQKDKRNGLTEESNRTMKKRRVLEYKQNRDKGMQKYGETNTVGGALARDFFLGGNYAKMRAAGVSARKAGLITGAATAAQLIPYGGSVAGRIAAAGSRAAAYASKGYQVANNYDKFNAQNNRKHRKY